MQDSLVRLTVLAVAFAGSTLLSGCGPGFSSGNPEPTAGVALRGSVHGGQPPVSGAHVDLLAANATGYGSASLSLLTNGAAGSDSIGQYVEFVGAGAPTVTPLALAIKNGTLGTRP